MKTIIHSKAQTPAGKLLGRKSVPPFRTVQDSAKQFNLNQKFTLAEIFAMYGTPTQAPAQASGIAVVSKPKPVAKQSVELVNTEWGEMLQFNCPSGGRPFKVSGRRAYEMLKNAEALTDFAAVYAETHGLPTPK